MAIKKLREPVMSIDKFKEPLVYFDIPAAMQLLSHLMLLEPGTYQSHPDMGVGLLTFFRYQSDDGTLCNRLESRINGQIDTYLPIFTGIEVQVGKKNNTFFVGLTFRNNVIFKFLYNTTTGEFNQSYSKVGEL